MCPYQGVSPEDAAPWPPPCADALSGPAGHPGLTMTLARHLGRPLTPHLQEHPGAGRGGGKGGKLGMGPFAGARPLPAAPSGPAPVLLRNHVPVTLGPALPCRPTVPVFAFLYVGFGFGLGTTPDHGQGPLLTAPRGRSGGPWGPSVLHSGPVLLQSLPMTGAGAAPGSVLPGSPNMVLAAMH